MQALMQERHGLAIEVGRLQAMRRVGEKGRFLRMIALTYGIGELEEFQMERKQVAIEEQLRQRISRMRAVNATIHALRRR
ncbi:hypothetical protein [Cryobacterium sp. TMT2-42-4]|uniref:hypothetical protein n=1 Tax=Cryobacterium sp. TMT2-42-4 TaxID=1259255 RepID=UPI00106D3EAC|nr:hypothetical protein [Cryobacterium sp. TMT2-42-4]TFC37983.1 hypothetical protein E3O18_03980 [Cryobacterium sp. TMT2-42-4]